MRPFLIAVVILTAASSLLGAVPALKNPERGLRFEIHIGLEDGEKYPTHLKGPWPFGEYALDEGVTLARAYCYLFRYAHSDIAESKLAAIRRDFVRARQTGVKLLLRFAYEKVNQNDCPEFPLLMRHLDQLLPIVRENADILHVVDVGIIGRFGEFHHCTRGYEKNPQVVGALVRRVLDALPEDLPIAMRYPKTRDLVASTLGLDEIAMRRIGWHNDGTLATQSDGGTFPKCPHGMRGNPVYDRICRESAFYPIEGELYWTNAQEVQPRANAIEAIRRLQDHHYTAFSLQHGWSGLDMHKGLHAIDAWMKTPVSAEMLAAYGIVPDRDYFERYPQVSGYEYIRDHLGYRLLVRGFEQTRERLSVQLANHGFAAPVKRREVHVVVRTAEGSLVDLPTGFDCRALAADFVPRQIAVALPKDLHPAKVYLWLPDASEKLRNRPEYAIRLVHADTEIAEGMLLNALHTSFPRQAM